MKLLSSALSPLGSPHPSFTMSSSASASTGKNPANPFPSLGTSSSSTSSTVKLTELKIGVPIEYDGNQETATGWLMSIKAYLLINNNVYNNNEKRVAFGLSHMKKAVAQSRKVHLSLFSLYKYLPLQAFFNVL